MVDVNNSRFIEAYDQIEKIEFTDITLDEINSMHPAFTWFIARAIKALLTEKMKAEKNDIELCMTCRKEINFSTATEIAMSGGDIKLICPDCYTDMISDYWGV